jgi:hypothetical protein
MPIFANPSSKLNNCLVVLSIHRVTLDLFVVTVHFLCVTVFFFCVTEESLAHRVCLLLVELHLCTLQPIKALTLISYIETQFVCTDSNITTDKDLKPLEKEHKEKKVGPLNYS